ncbi:MAG: FAD-dependent monooxygenase [Pseudomonadota bacterium]
MAQTVSIIGGGIGGLTAALCLRRQGFAVDVFEQAPALTEVGAGIQLGPNAMRVLAALSLQEALSRVASQPEQLALRSAYSGQLISSTALLRDGKPRWGAPYIHVHRADLIACLAEAAQQRGVTVHLGEAMQPSAADRDADALIFADGMTSGFAQRVFGRDPARYSGLVAWRALVPAERLRRPAAHAGAATIWSGRGCHAVTYTLRGGALMNFIGVVESEQPRAGSWDQSARPEEVLPLFRRFQPEVLEIIRQADQLRPWGLYVQSADAPWVDGRMALLGDACHAMAPFLAQGAAMAIEDAWALSVCLGQGDDVPAALKAYEHARKARVNRVATTSLQMRRLYHLKGLGERLGVFSALKSAQTAGASELLPVLDWLYGYDVTAGAGT